MANGGTSLGRFGWKANVPTVEQQNAGAFHGDIGITSSLFPDENCPPEQAACGAALSGGAPELDDGQARNASPSTRGRWPCPPAGTSGSRRRPRARSCSAAWAARPATCPSCAPARATSPRLSNQVIHPYTDLLLHDMGPGLADGRPDGEATGSEWRTPPLWGIGLVETVNRHTRFLHDGRARNLSEAILWHGGEAEASADAFRALPARARDALIAFLESL